LTQGDKVVGVRLSLFAEMMKGKPWTPDALAAVGGAEGVGVAFLEETFSAPGANPNYRLHQRAARGLLAALLPDAGGEIRGRMRSREELLAASGYSDRPRDFSELLRILDGELRLITPADPDAKADVDVAQPPPGGTPTPAADPRFYQLTHDYLIHALRDWLTRKQRETRRGRAELLLAALAGVWNANPSNRSLPTLGEYLSIRSLTRRRQWSEPQRKMMARAARVHGVRSAIVAALFAVVLVAGLVVRHNVIESEHARVLAASLATAEVAQVPSVLAALKENAGVARPYLQAHFDVAPPSSPLRLYAAVALLPDESARDYVLGEMLDASEQQFPIICDAVVHAEKERVVRLAREELAKPPKSQASPDDVEAMARRQAKAAVALLRCGDYEDFAPVLKQTSDPRVRSYVVHWAAPFGTDPVLLRQRWEQEADIGARRALTLMLGEFTDQQLPLTERQPLINKLVKLFETEQDAGLHAAAEWLLRQWGQEAQVESIVNRIRSASGGPLTAADKRQWFVNSQGQTFVILDAQAADMGSPVTEAGRDSYERQHKVHIGRRLAVAATPVTKAQFRVFQQLAMTKNHNAYRDIAEVVKTDDSPQTGVTWYEAAQYCNWLSDKEGLTECYLPNGKGEYGEGMKPKEGYLKLNGYRLPTEAEWEFACRATTTTSRYYGESELLLSHYAWYAVNAENRTWPVASKKPNDFGLFDMLGNSFQWCNDQTKNYPESSDQPKEDSGSTDAITTTGSRIARGGSFDNTARYLRSASRGAFPPVRSLIYSGFRPVRTLP
jgi:formylglycine-generating enzyme required for sulfatase activity